jgi:methyltransferase (TIGR00027 family)
MGHVDSTAVNVALWRAAHLILDDPPYVLEDSIGFQMVNRADLLLEAGYHVPDGAPLDAPGDDWLRDPRIVDDMRRRWRGSVLARARFVEDEVVRSGLEQYVILGAGLDSFALRRPDLAPRLQVFEVDQANMQEWKKYRIEELGFAVPPNLHFAPVDFENGESWVDKIVTVGFDPTIATFASCLGVTQYISKQATLETMRMAAALLARATFVCSLVLPAELIDPAEYEMRAATEQGAANRGHPWISFFDPREFIDIARQAGFEHVRHVSPDDLAHLYFAGRVDGLRPSSSDHLVIATA